MRELTTQVDIKASPVDIWEILMDFESYPSWNPFITSLEGEPKVGSKLAARIEPKGGKPMTFKPTVQTCEPSKKFEWLGTVGMGFLFSGRHFFELEKIDDETTRFIHREEFSGMLLPLLWNDLDTKTRAGFEAMNNALKEKLEKA